MASKGRVLLHGHQHRQHLYQHQHLKLNWHLQSTYTGMNAPDFFGREEVIVRV